jgi:hypothetical protein
MATKRKPPQKAGQLNFADELAQAVAKPESKESPHTERAPMVGERVTVATSATVWTILLKPPCVAATTDAATSRR